MRAAAAWILLTLVLVRGVLAQVVSFDFDTRPTAWANMAPIDGRGVSEWSAAGGHTGGALHVSAAGTPADAIRQWKTVLANPVPPAGRRLHLRAWIKGKDVQTVAAFNLRAHVKGAASIGAFGTTQIEFPLKGTFDWTEVRASIDVPRGTANVQILAMLVGDGEAWFDDVRVEVGEEVQLIVPGVFEVRGSMRVPAGAASRVACLPVPTSDADQCPLSYLVTVEPPASFARARIERNKRGDWEATVELHADAQEACLRWSSIVLVAPTDFAALPATAPIPAAWPKGFRQWTAEEMPDPIDPGVLAAARRIRGDSTDAMAILRSTLEHLREQRHAKGRAESGLEASRRLLSFVRAHGLPARLVLGASPWTGSPGPTWLVEACVRGDTSQWFPLEPDLLHGPWPNHQCVRLSVLGSAAEAKLLDSMKTPEALADTTCEPVRNLPAERDGAWWESALQQARRRWDAWLAHGKLEHEVASPGPAGRWFSAEPIDAVDALLLGK